MGKTRVLHTVVEKRQKTEREEHNKKQTHERKYKERI